MDLDEEELKATRAVFNLREYIEEDVFFSGKEEVKSDFDKFCYAHCKDIARLVKEYETQRKKIYNLQFTLKKLKKRRNKKIESKNNIRK